MALYTNKYYAGWASPNNLQGYLYIDQKDWTGKTAIVKKTIALPANTTYIYETGDGDTQVPFLIQVLDSTGNELFWYTYLEGTWKIGILSTGTTQTVYLNILYIENFTNSALPEPSYSAESLSLSADQITIYDTMSLERPFMMNLVGADGFLIPIELYFDSTWKIRVQPLGYSITGVLSVLYPIWFPSLTNGTALIAIDYLTLLANTPYIYDTGSIEKPFMVRVMGDNGSLLSSELYFDITWKLSIFPTEINQTGVIDIIKTIALNGPGGGPPSKIKLKANGIKINYSFEDWNNPIIGMQAEFEILNDRVDFYELLPLLIAEEREYRIRIVVIYPTAYTLFEGFLNCDIVNQKYLHKQDIKFVASSFLSKLEGIHPPSIDILQNKTFIDIIDEILTSTGAFYNIKVNSKLHAEGDILLSGQSLFNKNGFYVELFWEDDVTRASSLFILKTILTSFNSYIYWWEGYWYIERYEDIWSEAVDFVEYTTGTAYSPDSISTIAPAIQTISDVHTLKFTGQSQTLAVIPGLKTLKITLDDKRIFNLVLSTLKDVARVNTGNPEPAYRKFMVWEEDYLGILWLNEGTVRANINNAIQRTIHYTTVLPNYRGIYTAFKVTVGKDVQLTVTFKYSIDTAKIVDWTGNWKDYNFDFYWFLKIAGTYYYIVNSGEDWTTVVGTSDGILVHDELQMTTIAGSSFDPITKSVEVSISVPLGEVKTIFDGKDSGTLTGDTSFVFGIGKEIIHLPEEENLDGSQVSDCWFGDILVSTSGGVQNNVIEANVNVSGFLNSKELTMQLYDMESYNYKNGILRQSSLDVRTERWGTTGGDNNIKAKGVCWATTHLPVITDFHTMDGTGFEPFTSILTGLIPGMVYYARAYATTVLDITYYGQERAFGTKNLVIGDYHQGGYIFYILLPGDPGYDPLIKKGLIASPIDQTTGAAWMSLARPINTIGAFGTAIGTGSDNSLIMASAAKAKDHVISKVIDYTNDGYNDWYIPSIAELVQLGKNKASVPGLVTNSLYWSSSEVNPEVGFFGDIFGARDRKFAYGMYMNTKALPWTFRKNVNYRVRAIRAFIDTEL